ncbi:hypothetical protein [Pseudomonas phage PotUPM1]|nr:hypothetical protein [Pseudomonas phage PotUPM1]
MSENDGWPAPVAGVLNPIDDPYAAAQQMAVAIVSSGTFGLPIEAGKAADRVDELVRALLDNYLKLRDHYDGSRH